MSDPVQLMLAQEEHARVVVAYQQMEATRGLARMYVVAITGWDAPPRPPTDVANLADRLGSWQQSAASLARWGGGWGIAPWSNPHHPDCEDPDCDDGEPCWRHAGDGCSECGTVGLIDTPDGRRRCPVCGGHGAYPVHGPTGDRLAPVEVAMWERDTVPGSSGERACRWCGRSIWPNADAEWADDGSTGGEYPPTFCPAAGDRYHLAAAS